MVRVRIVILAVGAMLLGVGNLPAQRPRARAPARVLEVDPLCEQVLPAAAVERISHRENLRLVPRMAITGAGGTCNYAEDGTGMIVLVTIGAPAKPRQPDPYETYKRMTAYRKNQREINRLGDAAFLSGDFDQIVVVKKGGRVVVVSAFFERNLGSRTIIGAYLTREQVMQVAREVIGKL